jgi:hypothetical protein
MQQTVACSSTTTTYSSLLHPFPFLLPACSTPSGAPALAPSSPPGPTLTTGSPCGHPTHTHTWPAHPLTMTCPSWARPDHSKGVIVPLEWCLGTDSKAGTCLYGPQVWVCLSLVRQALFVCCALAGQGRTRCRVQEMCVAWVCCSHMAGGGMQVPGAKHCQQGSA